MPVLDLFSLAAHNALVTGASRGIGHACALALAQAGAQLCLVLRPADAEPPCVAALRAQLPAATTITVVYADLSDPAQVRAVFPQALALMGTIDVLVHCAGIQRRAPAVVFPESDWDDVLSTNLKAAFLLSQGAGAHMLPRGRGSIVHFASLLTFQGGLTVPAYAAAKGGLGQLVKALANEWSAAGVRVNAVVPGYVKTDMNEKLLADPTRLRQISERIPAGRWGEPADFAGPVVFLASQASAYVCGELLVVDGGWMGR
ncbi:hypothetical protein HYPSUDRAFT_37534 [Hypholoma sublateritium FD-334 SS-4]|uniref:Ketoreductase domain-containing protein n=1 Tax=Hypholoma sublateritium (strain FD-334 SS-4) TaxID=945553 RepID=A0A0D2P3U0_HYPSF|nr:hypothetical protein HYPSUDRAFT_37534 [Hypholoma sublateritium FD-334 SS-4]